MPKSNLVLSSYTPVNILGTRWALIAEIDSAEAFAPIQDLKVLALQIGIIGSVLIYILAFFMSRSIRRPILSLSQLFKKIDASAKTDGRMVKSLQFANDHGPLAH